MYGMYVWYLRIRVLLADCGIGNDGSKQLQRQSSTQVTAVQNVRKLVEI